MKTAVFSGTSEGRELAEFLSTRSAAATVFVATEYGSELMPKLKGVEVQVGRLNENEMESVLDKFDVIIDATHPYAAVVTQNIRAACKAIGKRYIRLLRDEGSAQDVTLADSVKAAAELLKNTDGNIFISTGSKELHEYAVINGFKDRLTARVLPTAEAREKCTSLGLKNVIYQKGPFDYDENYRQFKRFNIKYLVTKSSGKAGGFDEKISAAKVLGIKVIVIKRPDEDSAGAYTLAQVKEMFDNEY